MKEELIEAINLCKAKLHEAERTHMMKKAIFLGLKNEFKELEKNYRKILHPLRDSLISEEISVLLANIEKMQAKKALKRSVMDLSKYEERMLPETAFCQFGGGI